MTQQVLKDSFLTYNDELALFDRPLQDIGINSIHFVQHSPVTDPSNQSIIEFYISGTGSSYVDLKRTLLSISCKIVNEDGSNITSDDGSEKKTAPTGETSVKKSPSDSSSDGDDDSKVVDDCGPINNFLSSLISRVDVALQGHSITPADHLYSYMAYLKNLLFTSPAEKKGILQTELYYEDSPGAAMDAHTTIYGANQGLVKRASYFKNSKTADLVGPLQTDLSRLDKFIPHGISIRIKLYLNRPEFCLMGPSTTRYKYLITKASLNVCMVSVAPEIVVAHSEIMQSTPAIFPYIKTLTRRFTLPAGLHASEILDPFQTNIPSEFFIGLVREDAVHGVMHKNPFNFINADVCSIQCTVDCQDIGQGQIQTHYGDTPENSNYMEGYNTLRGLDNQAGIPITREQFHNGFTIYRFYSQMPKDNSNVSSEYIPLKRSGNLKISIKFAKALPEATTVIIMGHFPSAFKIDHTRAVYEI